MRFIKTTAGYVLALLWALEKGTAFCPRFSPPHNPMLGKNVRTTSSVSWAPPQIYDMCETVSSSKSSLLILSHEEGLSSLHQEIPYLRSAVGSATILLSIIGLLYTWEKSVNYFRKSVPDTLQPVLESILGEMGGLGAIGLIISTFLPPLREQLEEISTFFFAEPEAALETFEFLHQAVFQVGVSFFLAAGAMVIVGLAKLDEINQIEEIQVDPTTGVCTATTAESLIDFLDGSNVEVEATDKLPKLDLIQEIQMEKEERAAKVLLLRNRVMDIHRDLPPTFRVEDYISRAFATNLLELVEFSPLTWIFLVPALALVNSIDLSHEVINSSSANAAASSGYFFSSLSALIPNALSVIVSLVWGWWNCQKLAELKYMLLPRILKVPGDSKDEAQFEIVSPPIDSSELRKEFLESSMTRWGWFQSIESIWAKPPQSKYDEIFGAAGGAGLDLYRNSIQKQTWFCITQIFFFGTQIISRDLTALWTHNPSIGNPQYLVPELVTYGIFFVVSLLQLLYLSPRSFWNFCLVSSLQDGEESTEMMDQCRELYSEGT